mgnify:CR=1 FL=1|jgi:phosphoribosylformimino-5-aminoimidazole carboxamide ribotide isomerase
MIKIIPAIDIINGHCVRLSQGDYQRITDYSKSPAAMAENFEALGFKRLHVVDLDGARSGKVINIKALKEITSRTNLIVDFGGGIKSEEDLKNVFEAGASAVSIGSIAVSDPDIVSLWADSFGAEKFIISADVRDNIVRTNGWTKNSGITLNQLISRYWNKNIRRILCTDISRDGMLCGSNIELYQTIMEQFPDCKLIASGGISSLEDIKKLDEAKIPAVVIGKAIYEQQINLEELAQTFIQ